MAESTRTSHRIVIATMDGRRERGFIYSFSPNATSFHLHPTEGAAKSYAKLVELKDCKALFFVRSHEGSRAYREEVRKGGFAEAKVRGVRGHRMKITFADGEELSASCENYNPLRLGFFAFPLDPRSNNLRIFVVNANVRQVVTGPSAPLREGAPEAQARLVRISEPGAVEALHGAAPAPALLPPVLPPEAGALPVERRVEAVLRIVAGESALTLSEEMGIPAGVIGYWAQVFLQHGRASLGAGATDPRDAMLQAQAARIRHLEEEVYRLRAEAAEPEKRPGRR
jgi:hypothetical protein